MTKMDFISKVFAGVDDFDAASKTDDRTPLSGFFNMHVDRFESEGAGFSLEMRVLDGDYQGRRWWWNVRYDWQKGQYAALCKLLGFTDYAQPGELVGKDVGVILKVKNNYSNLVRFATLKDAESNGKKTGAAPWEM